ncbi:MAG TPA: helix-turn-helix transcriptional regulator [Caulobacteraceae bacterium]|nr:helix-turn-helix transcriptional regulator [Caulobacteraceae bacterium]
MTTPFATGANRIAAPAPGGRSPESLCPFCTEEAPRRLLAWLDADPRPRLLATAQGQVIWMSAAAAALPHGIFPFSPDGADDSGEERRIDPRLLAEVDLASGQLRCATAKPEFARQTWMVWAYPLPGAGAPVLALILRARRERPNLALLAEAGQLTRAEIRVIEMMMGGTETAAIAGTLGISLETLRTHVKHAYRKLGVTTRGELFAALADFLQP